MARNQAADGMRALLAHATEEVARRGDRRLGTDHLLLALLRQPYSPAARALGVPLEEARATRDALDQAALAAVGVTVATPATPRPVRFGRRLPPLTSGARAVVQKAMVEARPRRTGRLGGEHFLLAILGRQRPDPATELLHALGLDPDAVRARLVSTKQEGGA
jgi:ATP-dependent Clp protease ATP-binding subunit ClpA